uniref:Uncharacterized protein n=1 Tax=Magallana gigas TaxID=29159 RepID=K1QAJ1_MAGGI
MSLTGPCNKCEVGPQNFVESTDKQTDEMGKTMKGKTGNPLVSYLKLTISRTEVSCEDSAHYRCQMETIMADGSVKTYIKDTQISISATETLIYDSMKVYPKSQSSTPYGQYPLNTELTLSCSALVESESRDLTWCIYTGYSTKAMEYDTVKRSRVRMNKPCAYHLLSEIQYVLSENSEGYKNISNIEVLLTTSVPVDKASSASSAEVISIISIIMVFLLVSFVLAALWLYKRKTSDNNKKITLHNLRNYFRSRSIDSVSESCQTDISTTITSENDSSSQ